MANQHRLREVTVRAGEDDYASRPREVHQAAQRVSLTGRIERPMLTLHGTLDSLLPISVDSKVYADMVRENAGRDPLRYYRIEGGVHVDGLFALYPSPVRPLLPCYRSAFVALEEWVHSTVPRRAS